MPLQPCVLQITRRRSDDAIVPDLTGKYLIYYDPRRDAENCYYLTVTDKRDEAKVFDNKEDALHYYFQTSPYIRHPLFGDQVSQPLAEEYRVEIVFLPITNS